jgi:hypothetical protein
LRRGKRLLSTDRRESALQLPIGHQVDVELVDAAEDRNRCRHLKPPTAQTPPTTGGRPVASTMLGARVPARSRSSWPRSHGSPGAIGFPQRARAEDGAAGHLSSPSLTESLVLRAVAAESGCSSDDHGEISAAIGERNVTAAGWTSAHVKKPPPTSSLRQSGSGAQYSRVPSSPVCAPFRSVSSLRRRRAL